MSIVSQTFGLMGQTGVMPRRVQMVVTDSLATLTTAGYLNENGINPSYVYPTDIFDIIYLYTPGNASGTYGQFTASVSGSIITLSSAYTIGVPTVVGDLARFSSTTGGIVDSGILYTNVVAKNAVNAMATDSSIALFKATGTESGNAVTINQQAGVITTSSLSTAAAGTYVVALTNSFVTTSSVILYSFMGGTNTTGIVTCSVVPTANTATFTLKNNNASDPLNGTIKIGFTVV